MSTAQRAVLDFMGDNAVTTLWRQNTKDKYGSVTFLSPVLIDAEFRSEKGVSRGSDGQTINFTNAFYTEIDDTTTLIQTGDRVLTGDYTSESNPVTAGAYKVLDVVEVTAIIPGDANDLIVRC